MSRIKECSISIYEDRYIDGYDEITQQAANVLDSFTLTNIFNHTQIRFTQRFVLSKWLTPEQRQIMYNKFVDEILLSINELFDNNAQVKCIIFSPELFEVFRYNEYCKVEQVSNEYTLCKIKDIYIISTSLVDSGTCIYSQGEYNSVGEYKGIGYRIIFEEL